VNLLDYHEDANEIFIVTELIDGTDFFDYIKRKNLSERMLKDLLIEVCCGL
jgi:serine/threonine protein kinase